jgi:polysaccharide chain length determinant protein (PEP-CTERM system associated)
MMNNGTISLADAKRVLRRYWWMLPISMVVLGCVGYGLTKVLPKKYTSSTTVLVEQPVVPADYVRPVVQEDLHNHLASMQAEILSSSRLQPIIEKFDLFPDQRGQVSNEALQGQLRKSIDVELMQPMLGAVNRQPPGFHVSVTFNNPKQAQEICNEVTDMFMKENEKSRIGKAVVTTSFLSDQLTQAKEKLDEQDAKLADFKRKYLGSLPEEEGSNLSLLNGLESQLEATTQAVNRAQQDKTFNETLLSQQEANWKSMLNGGQQNPETQEQQLAALQEQYNSVLLRYKPEYPDAMKLKAQIDDLQRRMADGETAKPTTTSIVPQHEPAQLQSLRAKIKQDDLSIAELTKKQAQIQEQSRLLQGRIQASPMVEEQFKELNRNYQTAQQSYDQLLKNKTDAAMATQLEQQQQSETFQVLDKPNYPALPSFPNVLAFTGGGFGGGLVFGLAILYLIAMTDKAMYSERDVETCLKLPVLTVVPSLDQTMSRKSKEVRHPKRYEPSMALKA